MGKSVLKKAKPDRGQERDFCFAAAVYAGRWVYTRHISRDEAGMSSIIEEATS